MRLIDSPIAAGVCSRVRFRLRPSAASRAASKALQTAAGRRACDESLLVVMAGDKRALRGVAIGDDNVEPLTRPLRAFVSLVEGGDIEVHGGKVIEQNLIRRAPLKLGES